LNKSVDPILWYEQDCGYVKGPGGVSIANQGDVDEFGGHVEGMMVRGQSRCPQVFIGRFAGEFEYD
jgi:hypothetical protein